MTQAPVPFVDPAVFWFEKCTRVQKEQAIANVANLASRMFQTMRKAKREQLGLDATPPPKDRLIAYTNRDDATWQALREFDPKLWTHEMTDFRDLVEKAGQGAFDAEPAA